MMFRPVEPPYDTRFDPAPTPNVGVFESPTVNLAINALWVSHLDGLLERLLWSDAWSGTETEIDVAIQEVQKLLVVLGSGGNMTPVPIGTIAAFGGTTAPPGWRFCNGSTVSRSTYSALHAVIGNLYGAGDGATTFNLPDLQGRVPVGSGPGVGLTPRVAGEKLGEESHTLTTAEMPSHTHNARWSSVGAGGGSYGSWTYATPYNNNGGIVENTGGGQPHNNLQPSLVLNYIIYTGVS